MNGSLVTLPAGATDASLTPYHIDRAKLFVRERFGGNKILDTSIIEANIEHTRFPFPDEKDYQNTDDFPGLLRSADLIGQMADINYMRKISALYFEFQETGENARFGYANAAELRAGYPRFFWKMVSPFLDDAIRYLRVTQDGKQWIANLYAQVFAEEHQALDWVRSAASHRSRSGATRRYSLHGLPDWHCLVPPPPEEPVVDCPEGPPRSLSPYSSRSTRTRQVSCK